MVVEEIKIPEANIYLSSSWASTNQNHRGLLRQHIKLNYSDCDFSNLENRKPAKFISISHCKKTGGYLVANDIKRSIGFDIEEALRIKENIVKRISTKEEINLFKETLFISYLWVIKEAGFKAFSSSITTMSEVRVLSLDLNKSTKRLTGKLRAGDKNGSFYSQALNSELLFASVIDDEK